MPSGRTNNFPESGRGLGHVTRTIFGSTVGYPSDSLASCRFRFRPKMKQNPFSIFGRSLFLQPPIPTPPSGRVVTDYASRALNARGRAMPPDNEIFQWRRFQLLELQISVKPKLSLKELKKSPFVQTTNHCRK